MTENREPRYALYYAPPKDSGLWSAAQRWLGRDCESGKPLRQEIPDGWAAAEIAAATESPRRYGFHATLKAPFRLAPAASPDDLLSALSAFAARRKPFEAPPLRVSAIGPFLALTLSEASPAMSALADVAVQEMDAFRAPLTPAEMERRLAGGLTPRQQALLKTWGYPYVAEEFRFHMTLTGPLDAGPRDRLKTTLAETFQPHIDAPFTVDEICLYRQRDPAEPFLLTDRFRLGERGHAGETAALEGEKAP